MAWLLDSEKKFEDIFIHFGVTHERDRQTDGQTDIHRVPAIAALMHSIARQKLFSDANNRKTATLKQFISCFIAPVRTP